MARAIKLHVKWTKKTAERFRDQGINIPWDEKELVDFQVPQPPLTIEDLGAWIETRVERMYARQTGGEDQAQVQVRQISKSGGGELAWDDIASQHLRDGDMILVSCMAITESMAGPRRPSYTEEDLNNFRKQLRYGLNDRVMCFCGPRWLSGHIVGTAVPDEDSLLPYLVKTDPVPGLPSKTISVPGDQDDICRQEVCFDPESELHLAKAAATLLTGSQRPKLRFAAGAKVVCRLKSVPSDGLERWVAGTIASIWPELPGQLKWEIGGISGEYPSVVAYKIDLSSGGWVYCHRDHHTLIRREGMQPQTRVKGTSKRMEVRSARDGGREQVDHQTERSKRMLDCVSDGED